MTFIIYLSLTKGANFIFLKQKNILVIKIPNFLDLLNLNSSSNPLAEMLLKNAVFKPIFPR